MTGAYNDLLALPSEEGFANAVLEGRRQLLDLVKDTVVLSEGRVQEERGVTVPLQLLPSALVLLNQVCWAPLLASLPASYLLGLRVGAACAPLGVAYCPLVVEHQCARALPPTLMPCWRHVLPMPCHLHRP